MMSSKEPKIKKTLDDDRISTLPDDLLCVILSFLPTKYAVATTILSTRWKYLFASIPNIDLDYSLLFNPQEEEEEESIFNPAVTHRFIEFVYRILLRNSSNINRFRLKCIASYDNSTINAWISAVLWRNVQELDICVAMKEFGTLTREIYACKTIVVLKLHGFFTLNVPSSFSLPNLKILNLEYMKLTDDDSIRRVLSSCPVLEDLLLYACRLETVRALNISIPSLKNLVLHYFQSGGEYQLIRIVINTPNLEYFKYVSFVAGADLVKNLKSLVRADITIALSEEQKDENSLLYGEYVAKLVNAMYNVKYLHLSEDALEALFYSRCSLPTFQNLTFMSLDANHICGW